MREAAQAVVAYWDSLDAVQEGDERPTETFKAEMDRRIDALRTAVESVGQTVTKSLAQEQWERRFQVPAGGPPGPKEALCVFCGKRPDRKLPMHRNVCTCAAPSPEQPSP